MTNSNFQNLEGHSINSRSSFDGIYYNYSKARMMIYVQSMDYNIWEVIEFGPYWPTKVVKIDGKLDEKISKPREEDK